MPRVTKATNKKETKKAVKSAVESSAPIDKEKSKKEKTTKKVAPKATKEVASKASKKSVVKKATAKVDVKKSTTKTAVKAPEKKVSAKANKKTVAKKVAPKIDTKTPAKRTTKKVTTKSPDKKTASKKVAKNDTSKVENKSTRKASSKASAKVKKATTTKESSVAKKSKINTLEYYDLPYRYNQTVVRILAQTPNTLFVYWDISDSDREKFVKEFGEYFFNDTIPILIVHNKTKNYSFEVEINDFANSWYFEVADAKCDYEIEFGRRKKAFRNISIPNDYVYITSSNVIESPNDKILFEPNAKTLFFRNVKTNREFSKDVATFSFMEKLARIYNIYDLYKEIYKEEDLIDAINNPTSSGSSSVFYKKD